MAYLTYEQFMARAVSENVADLLSELDEAERRESIEEVIADVSPDLDGYAEPVYTTPLVATRQVQRIIYQLAWYALCERREFNITEQMEKAHDRLVKKLGLIASRKFHLTDQDDRAVKNDMTSARPTSPAARVSGRKRTFTREKLEGF